MRCRGALPVLMVRRPPTLAASHSVAPGVPRSRSSAGAEDRGGRVRLAWDVGARGTRAALPPVVYVEAALRET